jgi:hypothetical protein
VSEYWNVLRDEDNVHIFIVNVIMSLVILSVLLFTIFNYKHPHITARNFGFLFSLEVGLMLAYGSSFFFVGEPKQSNCTLKMWMPCVGWSLVVG